MIPQQNRLEFYERLGDSWHELADILGIPYRAVMSFARGREPQAICRWLIERGRMMELPGALNLIGREDLVELAESFAGGTGLLAATAEQSKREAHRPVILRWKTQLGGPIFATPAVAGGVVYISSYEELYALDAATGAIRWKTRTGSHSLGSPVVYGGKVYVDGGRLVCALDATTGEIKWKTTTEGNVSSPAVAKGSVFVANNAHAYALDATTGAVQWISTIEGMPEAPAIAGGTVFICADRHLWALDVTTGAIQWKMSAGERFSPPPYPSGHSILGLRVEVLRTR